MNIFEFIWFALGAFIFISYLIILFHVVGDIFADSSRSGWGKALWMVLLIVLPVFGGLAYIIAHGNAMAMRRAAKEDVAQEEFERYVRTAAGSNLAQQISEAKALHNDGVLSEEEFKVFKERLLRA